MEAKMWYVDLAYSGEVCGHSGRVCDRFSVSLDLPTSWTILFLRLEVLKYIKSDLANQMRCFETLISIPLLIVHHGYKEQIKDQGCRVDDKLLVKSFNLDL